MAAAVLGTSLPEGSAEKTPRGNTFFWGQSSGVVQSEQGKAGKGSALKPDVPATGEVKTQTVNAT